MGRSGSVPQSVGQRNGGAKKIFTPFLSIKKTGRVFTACSLNL